MNEYEFQENYLSEEFNDKDGSFYSLPDRNDFQKIKEKKEIRKLGSLIGCALLLMYVIQNAAGFLLGIFDGAGLYAQNPVFQNGFDIILTLLSVLLPFAVYGRYMQKVTGVKDTLMLVSPEDSVSVFLAVIAGVGCCMAANIVSAYVVSFIEMFGFELSSPEMSFPLSNTGILVTFARVAVTAAFVEELCMRGHVMGNLRKYSDTFAVIISGLVFGLMHGNLIQAPFAFIAGVSMGYFVIKTNSLWTGIFIHLINNTISVTVSYVAQVEQESYVDSITSAIVQFCIFAGVTSAVFFIRRNGFLLKKGKSSLNAAQKTGAFFSSLPMIAAIIVMLAATAMFVSFSS